jgi:mono/diheme cytochrome c family protein
MGPALLPGNLKRLRKKAAVDVIGNGRIATQMPAFADKLTPADIEVNSFTHPPAKPSPGTCLK